MADVSKIKLPSGVTYDIKDDGALPLTGGTVTGPVIFQDTISMDEATIGDLVVNGSASFTNNIQANTINGVAVGSSPKFTDTVTTISTTGNGNAITAITASNGVLSATKGSTFLTGITGSQVTTALGYTPYNSTNPNGYTTNTGTVTKVTAGTGLSIGTTAGGNFTTTGTINHTNSVTAQTTQAVYPIKIDAQGHISAYGSAVDVSKELFMITLTEDDNTGDACVDKTFNEIWAAYYNEGKCVIGYAPDLRTYYYLKYIDGHGVYLEQLTSVNDESHVIENEGLFIDSYNQVEITGTQIVVPATGTMKTTYNSTRWTWYYKKIDTWYEFWCPNMTLGTSTFATWTSPICYHDFSAVTYPITFSSAPMVQISSKNSQSWVGSTYSSTPTTQTTIRMLANDTGSRTCIVDLYVAGDAG